MNITITFSDVSPSLAQSLVQVLASAGPLSSDADDHVDPAEGRPFVGDGVSIPHGTKLFKHYKGKDYHAVIDDGKILFDGERYDDLSPAAEKIAKARGASYIPNGWYFWRMLIEGKWTALDELRERR